MKILPFFMPTEEYLTRIAEVDPYNMSLKTRLYLNDIFTEGLGKASGTHVRRVLGEESAVLITGLPIDPVLPTTPLDGLESPDKKTLISECLLVGACGMLGMAPMSYHNEKGGNLIHDIVPIPGREQSKSNEGSETFSMHIEAPHHPHPPEWIGLIALRNSEEGATSFVNIGDAYRAMPFLMRKALLEPIFTLRIGESFGSNSYTECAIAELDEFTGKLKYRVDLSEMVGNSDFADSVLATLAAKMADLERSYVLKPGEMLLLNNRIMAHGRVSFMPDYSSGEQRWLQRMYMVPSIDTPWIKDLSNPYVWDGNGLTNPMLVS